MAGQYDPTRPREDSEVKYSYKLPDVPGKTVVGIYTILPANGATPSHTHENASITSFVISGTYRGAVNNGEPFVFHAGQAWFEVPQDHVTLSENPSKTEPAIFLSTVVIDSDLYDEQGDDALYKIDPPYN
ncbi:hypothetical protein VN97_g3671 [Penicillium thymicola]|uniref:Cupin type-2 domain-containing protein n=1 Tax=Penicillium thymicola TaxID=293382 RepID=A0AAI9TN61_PENTH|nr:hypothetical protein VN97_g3671 [Penicillium thymicola]